MRYLCGVSRDQVMLLPETVDEYVGEDNPVRVIEAFVEWLTLSDVHRINQARLRLITSPLAPCPQVNKSASYG